MRKLLIVGLFWIVAFSYAQAQVSEPAHRWSVGIKSGSTFSFITRTNRQYASERPSIQGNLVQGYTGGLSIQYFTETHFALQIEGYYMQKGWRQEFPNPDNPDRISDSLFYEVTLNYVEVPLMAHGYIGQKNVRIFLEGGLYLGYLLSYETRREQSITEEQITYMMRMGNANRMDLGIRGAGGFEVATKAGTFQLGVSFDYGLGSVLKRYQTTATNASRNIPNMLQNVAAGITLGYFVEFD